MQEISRSEFCQKLRSVGFSIAFLSAATGGVIGNVEHLNQEILEPFRHSSFVEGEIGSSGRYFIAQHGSKDQVDEAIEKSNFFAAFSLEVPLPRHRKAFAGDHSSLIKPISDLSYLRLRQEFEFLPGSSLEIFLIPVPSDPKEIESVVGILRDSSMFFFFPDDTREFHSGNYRRGNGLQLQRVG